MVDRIQTKKYFFVTANDYQVEFIPNWDNFEFNHFVNMEDRCAEDQAKCLSEVYGIDVIIYQTLRVVQLNSELIYE